MKAEPFIIRKRVYPNGDIVEIKAWYVARTKDKPHGFKYSLVFIRNGKRIIGYDNAEGKGDHRHYKGNPQFNKEVQHLGKDGNLSECTNKHINISPAKRETR